MAIVNVTADSFSGDGVLTGDDWDRALAAGVRAAADAGADWIDVGAESTRPGATPVPEATELAVVRDALPIVREGCDLPISIDTSKAAVADAACALGASMVNDVTALANDPEVAAVAAARGAELVLMHNRAGASTVAHDDRLGAQFVPPAPSGDIVAAVLEGLEPAISAALAAGVRPDGIWLDPGIGFGKTQAENLELVRRGDELLAAGRPVLVGPSRKGFIGRAVDRPVDQRDPATAAVVALLAERGIDMVRVHDVATMRQVVDMVAAVHAG
ncbi:MAG: dihydropteroate synthase [Actinomycetota bacterium]|nr:dihydropteroate synthase [Actinomycetota bacterium]